MKIFFEIWHSSWAIFGVFMNFLLIYVAVFKSPKAIRAYATLIINFGITDFVECILDWFLQIRLLPAPGDVSITYIMNGACKHFGELTCRIGTSFFLHCIPHSIWSMLISFSYRYYILHHAGLSRSALVKIILLAYLPSLFQGLTYWSAFVQRSEILPLAEKWFAQYNLSEETGVITGIVDATNWAAAYGILHLCLPICPVYAAIFILRRKIVRHLEESKNMMAKETKAAHSQLLRALTLQACIPAFMSVAVFSYVASQTGFIRSPILEYLVFSSAILMPSLSPLTYLFFVRPYRQFFQSKLRKVIGNGGEGTTSKTGKFVDSSNSGAITTIRNHEISVH